MKEALYILNHKLIGNTMEQEEDLKDYERLLISSNIIAINEEDNPIIENLLTNNSYYISNQTYYLGFKRVGGEVLDSFKKVTHKIVTF